MEEILKRQQRRLREAADDFAAASEAVWEMVIAFQNYPFFTVRNCEFRYTVKGHEIKISRVDVALKRALELARSAGRKNWVCSEPRICIPCFCILEL